MYAKLLRMSSCDTAQSWFYRGREAAQELGADAAAFHERAEAFGVQTPGHEHRACERGCSFCCHYPVGTRVAELRGLAAALSEDAEMLASLRPRLLAEAREREALGWDALALARRPCPLLDESGSCQAHASRPLACRAWNSWSRESCEREFRGEPGAHPELDRPMHFAILGLAEGLSAALSARQEEGRAFELVSGLARLLSDELGPVEEALEVGSAARS
jgi:Fe-S-cluster containining protein